MVLLLITGNKIIRTILNKNVIGNYWVTGPLNSEQIINIEGISEGWEVKSNPDYTLLDSNQNPKETILLEEYSLYYVKVNKTNEIYLLYKLKKTKKYLYRKCNSRRRKREGILLIITMTNLANLRSLVVWPAGNVARFVWRKIPANPVTGKCYTLTQMT